MIFKENLTSKYLQKETFKVLERSKKPKKILEIGCGDGNISRFLIKNYKKFGHSFSLSDISEIAVKTAKKNAKVIS